MTSAPVAIITHASPKYWEMFGRRWIESVEALTVQPEQVIVVTEADVDVPSHWDVLRFWDDRIWPCVNVGVRHAKTEWATNLCVDDTMDANFFDGLVLAGDAVNVAGRWAGGLCYGTPDQYERLLDLGHNGMPGLAVIRTEVWRRIPYRAQRMVDWLHWCELRANGINVTFDRAVRWTWQRHEDAGADYRGTDPIEEVKWFCQMLKQGRVVPGEEWPPNLQP
jgi:hypothetical protein